MTSFRILPVLASAAILISACGGGDSPSVLDGETTCALLTEADFEGVEGTISTSTNGDGNCIWSDDRGDLVTVNIEQPEADEYEFLKSAAEGRNGEPEIDGIDATLVTPVSASGYAGGVSFTAFVKTPDSLEFDRLVELLERWASA